MKKVLLAVLAAVTVFALVACSGGNQGGASKGGKLIFTTGGDTGTYYGFGGVLAQYVSSNTETQVTVISSGGSQANLEDLAAGGSQIGFSQSDVLAYAYKGTRLFEGAAITNLSTVCSLYVEDIQIVTTNPDIKTVADLKGKTVSVGDRGSGTYFNAVDILGVYGLTEDDINPVYQGFGDSADSLKDGKIDAAFIVAGAPTTAVTDLCTAKQVYLVGLDEEHIAKLQEVSPYYSVDIIAADTYSGVAETKTVAVDAVLLAGDDVSEADIYNFVKAIYDNKAEIATMHAKGTSLSLDRATSVTTVPYHKGAAKYFKEQQYDVPTK